MLSVLAIGWLVGCGGQSAEVKTPAPTVSALPPERLAAAWPLQYAEEASLAAVSGPAWAGLVNTHDLASAVQGFGPTGGLPGARAHLEASALLRQAALLEANSLIQTYAATPEPTDPVGVAHLLTVSFALTGDFAKAKEWSGKLDGVTADPTLPWHGPWKAWIASADKPVWPPDLSGLPDPLPAPALGGWPELASSLTYALPEQGSASQRDMGDPGVLVRLALWHEAAALSALPEQKAALSVYLAPYRLPVEPLDAAAPLPAELLFGGEYLVPDDASFLAALRADGVGAVEAWKDRSLIALLAVQSRGADGKIDPLAAADQIAGLRDALVSAASAKTGGTVMAWQRTFAAIGSVGALRHLALVAEAEGNRETAGRLRIGAMEGSSKETANPAGLMALAAWDAGNRYPMRAQEILHAHLSRFPALEVARYGLDVLALRVSRERPGESAGM